MFILHTSDIPHLVGTVAHIGLTGISLALLVALSVVACDYIDGWAKRRALGKIPIVDEGSNMSGIFRWSCPEFDGEGEYAKAYERFSKTGKPFATRMQNDGYGIVLPPSSGKEWRGLPHEQLSFLEALGEFADMSVHSYITDKTSADAIHSCNNVYSLSKFTDVVTRTLDRALPLLFTQSKTQEHHVLQTIVKLCSMATISVLLGEGFTASSELEQALALYNESLMPSCYQRAYFPRILRQLVWRFAPHCRRLRDSIISAKAVLVPEIRRRVEIMRSRSNETEIDRPSSLLDALIETCFRNGTLSPSPEEVDCAAEHTRFNQLVEQVMMYSFEITRPTAMNITFKLYVIMNHKEFLDPLRDEIGAELSLSNGQWTLDTLKNCPKLESFSREAYRLYDISPFVSYRRVMKPTRLHTLGLSLKPGQIIMTPCRNVHLDADNYQEPATFDPWRFYDSDQGVCSPQASTTSPAFLTFSHGGGVCPARALATQISRIVFMKFLMRYDVDLLTKPMGAYGITQGAVYFPNPSVRMRVRPR